MRLEDARHTSFATSACVRADQLRQFPGNVRPLKRLHVSLSAQVAVPNEARCHARLSVQRNACCATMLVHAAVISFTHRRLLRLFSVRIFGVRHEL